MPFTRRQSRLASASTPAPVPASPAAAMATGSPAATPKAKSTFAFLNSITHRQTKTPKASPIKPSEPGIHPQRKHRTSTTPYDEARWLGFFNMGAQTAPAAKTASFTATETSPSPTRFMPVASVASPVAKAAITSPDFQFSFRRAPSVELSDDAQKIMAESREEAARIRAQLASLPTVPDTEPEDQFDGVLQNRKFAKPKGKVGRFSDVHMESFKKMDSIANHASSWRMNPAGSKNAPAPAAKGLKRSPSKAELDKPAAAPALKRSPSKPDLLKPTVQSLHRVQSKPSLKGTEPSPFLTRSPSKLGLAARAADERPMPSAKRVKHAKEDDVGTTRPAQMDPPSSSSAFITPRRQTAGLVRAKSGLLRPGFSSAMSPTKSSIARMQSMRDLRTTTQIPALVRSSISNNLHQAPTSALPRSKSMRDLHATSTPRSAATPITNPVVASPSPTKIALISHDTPVKAPELARNGTSSPMSIATGTPKYLKSILRTSNRRYTRDPVKIAAGTHMATPPRKDELTYPSVPATEPITKTKRVDFTNSTKEKAERDAFKAASMEPESVEYPNILPEGNRRTTMAAVPPQGAETPGMFTFRSDREISFGLPKTTIRPVRSSDAGLPPAFQFTGARAPGSPEKRQFDAVEEADETSEKENWSENEHDGQPPAKKARVISGGGGVKSAPSTPARAVASKLPRFGTAGKARGALSAARLSLLARPKKRV